MVLGYFPSTVDHESRDFLGYPGFSYFSIGFYINSVDSYRFYIRFYRILAYFKVPVAISGSHFLILDAFSCTVAPLWKFQPLIILKRFLVAQFRL